MRLIEGLDALRALDLGATFGDTPSGHSVVAVGVFDGVHLGHQRLLHELLEMASTHGGVPTVVTFANHPDQLLHGQAPPPLVSTPHRLRLLRRAGVLRLVLLEFEPRLMNMTARAFATDLLVQSLRARGLLLGYDSALGKDREGTPARFAELGAELGFEVRTGAPFRLDGETVSSTAIRAAITRGDLGQARRFLGRYPGALGTVVHGNARGQQLGFPTANMLPQPGALPPAGVYVVEAIVDGVTHPAVANLGVRPTFASSERSAPPAGPVLEVHLLDFHGDLYDRELEIAFHALLRPERKFANADELRAQIGRDVAAARTALRA
jgi:riboflavin kinase / FMN adenylyltransferase